MTIQECFPYMDLAIRRLNDGGFFLNVGSDKPNAMTVGWGSAGIYWGLPVLIVPVRYSRHSFKLLDELDEFTVSLPGEDNPLKKALAYIGTRSGRDEDKYAACSLTLQKARSVSVPVIAQCAHHIECRVIYKQTLDQAMLPGDIKGGSYPKGDFHTLFYGQIIECY